MEKESEENIWGTIQKLAYSFMLKIYQWDGWSVQAAMSGVDGPWGFGDRA